MSISIIVLEYTIIPIDQIKDTEIHAHFDMDSFLQVVCQKHLHDVQLKSPVGILVFLISVHILQGLLY